nr:hypothetical protein Iba_chr11fCG3190 [Ipomoea batatas]
MDCANRTSNLSHPPRSLRTLARCLAIFTHLLFKFPCKILMAL